MYNIEKDRYDAMILDVMLPGMNGFMIAKEVRKAGIKCKNDMIFWNGLQLPVVIDYDNYYEYQALQSPISYCRIIRKSIKHKYHYYVQVVFKGVPPIKINTETGEIKHPVGTGDVGIDIGTSTIAISSRQQLLFQAKQT